MQSCKNAIEELVIAEIDLQISHLPQYRRDQISLSEVAAYALNRLPPMYATSKLGWLRQRKKATTEMRSQPVQAVNWQEVQQSMQIASRNTENDDEWE